MTFLVTHAQYFYFQVVAIISITFIVLSTVVLTLNTLPYFDKRDENNNERDYPPFALLEAIYMSWFTFEFLIRLISCPSKVKFIKSPMNVIGNVQLTLSKNPNCILKFTP